MQGPVRIPLEAVVVAEVHQLHQLVLGAPRVDGHGRLAQQAVFARLGFHLGVHARGVVAELPDAGREDAGGVVEFGAQQEDDDGLGGRLGAVGAVRVGDLGAEFGGKDVVEERVAFEVEADQERVGDVEGEEEECGENGVVEGEDEDESGLEGGAESEPGWKGELVSENLEVRG